MSLAFDSWSMGIEASTVIGLRLATFAGGGMGAAAEARRMVDEKVEAALDLQKLAMTGRLGSSVESATSKSIQHYAAKVRANRRRLSRKRRAGPTVR
jgi:hypothetical protein